MIKNFKIGISLKNLFFLGGGVHEKKFFLRGGGLNCLKSGAWIVSKFKRGLGKRRSHVSEVTRGQCRL